MKRLFAVCLWFAAACFAQGPRVMIITDMEGAGGVNDAEEQLLPGQRRYDHSRHILTGETNAAVEGARKAGASEVVIWDGHDSSRSLAIDEIHPFAKLIQGRKTPANFYFTDKGYDGVMFIGQHAMAGARNGVLAHSQSFNVKRIAINGKDVGEIGQAAAIAGYFGIPVIMLAGDEAACAEIQDLQPKAVTVAVKRLMGTNSTLSLSHTEAKRQIEQAAEKAVSQIKNYTPWKITGPVEMTIEDLPQPPQHPTPRVQAYRGGTVLEAFEAWLGKP
jgi:D-amino peptidase